MKQVPSTNYDRQYYYNAYGRSVFSAEKGFFESGHSTIFEEIVGLCPLNPEDMFVDYGCGTGDLCFLLAARYGCKGKGLDYSKDAIEICHEKLSQVPVYQGILEFINCNHDQVHNFNWVKVVYLCDVVEHLYDQELAIVLSRIKDWNKESPIKVAIHTDNHIYLRYIRPFFNLLDIIFGHRTFRQVRAANKFDRSLHVNLTTPGKLRAKMENWGYKEVKLKYPTMNRDALIRAQLGSLCKIPFLVSLCTFLLKRLEFLSPSFYALYEKQ